MTRLPVALLLATTLAFMTACNNDADSTARQRGAVHDLGQAATIRGVTITPEPVTRIWIEEFDQSVRLTIPATVTNTTSKRQTIGVVGLACKPHARQKDMSTMYLGIDDPDAHLGAYTKIPAGDTLTGNLTAQFPTCDGDIYLTMYLMQQADSVCWRLDTETMTKGRGLITDATPDE